AAGAIHFPTVVQGFTFGKDFLYDEPWLILVQRPWTGCHPLFERVIQLPTIGNGIRESIDMGNAQAVDQALLIKTQWQGMHGVEHLLFLDANTYQYTRSE